MGDKRRQPLEELIVGHEAFSIKRRAVMWPDLMNMNNIVVEGIKKLGVMTFTAGEMTFNLLRGSKTEHVCGSAPKGMIDCGGNLSTASRFSACPETCPTLKFVFQYHQMYLYESNPTLDVDAKALSIRDIANRFGLSPTAVQREMRALKEGRPNSKSSRPCGRPRKLTESDHKALTLYVCFMARGATPVTKPLVRVAIDELIASRTPPGKPISDSSMDRFWRERRDLHVSKIKTVELTKLSLEHQVEAIEKYYSLRKKTIASHRIHILLRGLAESSKLGVDDVIEAIEAVSDEDGDLTSNRATPHSYSVLAPRRPETGYDHTIRFWEALSGICSRTIQHPDSQVNRLCISPDKRFLAAAGHHSVKLYDIKSTNPNALLTFEGHTGNITGVAFHCEGKWMVTSSEDGTVKVWETRSGTIQRSYNHGFAANDVVIHPNQGEIISCDRGGSVRVWDLAENNCSHQLIPEEDVSVSSVTVASDGSLLCAANNAGNVFVWSLVQTYEHTQLIPLTQFSAHKEYITRILLSPDVKKLATCSADHTAKIWSVPVTDSDSAENPPLDERQRSPSHAATCNYQRGWRTEAIPSRGHVDGPTSAGSGTVHSAPTRRTWISVPEWCEETRTLYRPYLPRTAKSSMTSLLIQASGANPTLAHEPRKVDALPGNNRSLVVILDRLCRALNLKADDMRHEYTK
ncbi:hypothetical protein CIB48_g11515 [Xylaria polymorpha]|nr:hypothetical protein CIB48_g11515 [Xylaria polymorpha]